VRNSFMSFSSRSSGPTALCTQWSAILYKHFVSGACPPSVQHDIGDQVLGTILLLLSISIGWEKSQHKNKCLINVI
jgi:hypothetical protein